MKISVLKSSFPTLMAERQSILEKTVPAGMYKLDTPAKK